MHVSSYSSSPARIDLIAVARLGDLVMLLTLAGATVAALVIGQHYGQLMLAGTISAVLLSVGGIAFALLRGHRLGSMLLTACNVGAVALHIQLGRGTIEFHFGVFMLLGLLLV